MQAACERPAGNKSIAAIGADGRTINSSAYPSFISGGRNSTGH